MSELFTLKFFTVSIGKGHSTLTYKQFLRIYYLYSDELVFAQQPNDDTHHPRDSCYHSFFLGEEGVIKNEMIESSHYRSTIHLMWKVT